MGAPLMTTSGELIDDLSVADLSPLARALLFALRMIAAGRGACPRIPMVLAESLGPSLARCATEGMSKLVPHLPEQCARRITLAPLCCAGVSWDEAAILALIDAAAEESATGIAHWFGKLTIQRPSDGLQNALATVAAATVDANMLARVDIVGVTRMPHAPRKTISSQKGAS
jgi:hypothetical protein